MALSVLHLSCSPQMVTIHGHWPESGYTLPLSYSLLPGKTTEHYVELFKAIDSYGPFEPETIMLPFVRFGLHALLTVVIFTLRNRFGLDFLHSDFLKSIRF